MFSLTSQIASFGKSHPGLKRSNNEDAFIVRPELGFCLVADGMGGAAAGEVASSIFAETTLEVFSRAAGQSEQETVELIQRDFEWANAETTLEAFSRAAGQSERKTVELVQRAFEWANERILDHVKKKPHHKGMGCTAELVAFSNEGFVLGHIGDSRTYRFRDLELKQLTQDHSLVQDQIDQGLITPAEARNHPMRNVILRALGVNEYLSLDIVKGKPLRGDVFLLCSDGLTDMVDDTLIQEVLSSNTDLPQKAEKLIELANSAGGRDNITVVLSEV